MRNKANFQTATRAGRDGRSWRWDQWYKRSQFADTDRDGRGPAKSPREPSLGSITPNEPNWPAPTGKGAGRRSRTHGRRWGQARQTKPIPRVGKDGRWPARSPLPAPLGPKRAKQSQFPAERQGEQVLDRKRVMANRTCKWASAKQSQFPPGPQWARADKAARAAGGTQRTKQSQFAVHRPDEAPTARAASAAPVGDKRAKRSQFRLIRFSRTCGVPGKTEAKRRGGSGEGGGPFPAGQPWYRCVGLGRGSDTSCSEIREEPNTSGGKIRWTNAPRREGLLFRPGAVFQRGRPLNR